MMATAGKPSRAFTRSYEALYHFVRLGIDDEQLFLDVIQLRD